ncbi:MAG: DUF4397 domain-containing protein [Bryobacteraceae bacterium]|nr:DUF4397 domain-containing protein [Bryobacteraceae bacterium]
MWKLLVFSAVAAVSMMGQDPARVRVLHASPDAPAVDIWVDGAKVLEGIPFREYSEYLPVPAGSRNIQVAVSGTTNIVLQASPQLAAGRDYTAIAAGFATKSPALELLLLEDDNRDPANGNMRVRVVHAAPSAPGVDVYVTTPFETLDGKRPVLTAVPFKAVSGYLEVPYGTYQARVTPAGTRTVAIDSGRWSTWNLVVRTVVAVDNTGGGAPFSLLLLADKN